MQFAKAIRRVSDKALDKLVRGASADASCSSSTWYTCVKETWGCRTGLCRYECHRYTNCAVVCTKLGSC